MSPISISIEWRRCPRCLISKMFSQGSDSGRKAELLKSSFYLIYGELIEGEPDHNFHEYILETLQTKFPKNQIPMHLRRPSQEQIKGELPVFYGVAEWANYKKSHEEGWSSELRVVWFMDSIGEGLSFQEMLQQSLRGLDWDQFAAEYDPSSL